MKNLTLAQQLMTQAVTEEEAPLISLNAFRSVYNSLSDHTQVALLQRTHEEVRHEINKRDRAIVSDTSSLSVDDQMEYQRVKIQLRTLCNKLRKLEQALAIRGES